MATSVARPTRDLRLDFFRGLSLFLIFIDHIPGNVLSYFTLRSFAFSDAAEAFIFISGFTAAIVYGTMFRQRGLLLSVAHTYRRVWQLYVAHVFLFVIFTAEVSYTLNAADNPMYAEEMGVGDFLSQPHIAIIQALLLRFQPTFLDILPLYIVMLAGFPVAIALIHRHPLWALIPSALLYGAVYDPFPPVLLQVLWRPAIDKTNLSPVRLVNFLALAIVVISVVPRESAFLKGAIARPIVLCGQNSLYIFCLGILLAVLGHFVLAEITDRIPVQLLVNAAGVILMIFSAFIIAWYKKASRPTASAAVADSAE